MLVQYAIHISEQRLINGSQMTKIKRTFLTCPRNKIYRVDAVGLKSAISKNYDFYENVKFGAILRNIYVLSVTA